MESQTRSSLKWLPSSQNPTELTTKPPRRKLIIERQGGLQGLEWATLWEYRDLLYLQVWREIKVRYKQTAIGVSWVLLQPMVTMLIFTVIFGQMAKVPSDGVWYPAFVLSGLLPWTYFSQAVTRAGGSLVSNANLVTKIYFPRVLLPLASIVAPLVDLALSLLLLFGLLMYAGIPLTWKIFTLPIFIVMAMLTAMGLSLFVSATNVRYRDVTHAIPFVIQVWMFVSPIVYPVSLVPEQWRLLYGLNPMTGVIEGFRWAMLGQTAPDPVVMGASAGVVVLALIAGSIYFKKLERQFADVI